ncbi:WD repeat and coiled-coil-containing protein-like [Rhinophrynus dorsalis]
MDLGKAKILRNGVNALYQAIHPLHGLAWTDGRQVVLTAFHLDNEEPKFGNSVVIGQFEHVYGLYWGPLSVNDIPALLAVQHKKHVTIWQLYYSPQEKNKLIVSQTCEIGDPLPVLPQGCIWHPSKDILVVLTKRDVSVLYSVCQNNNNVKADIKGSGVICAACWTKDGSRLVVAIDSALYSYIWDDAQKTLNPCTFCPILDTNAKIYAIQPVMQHHIVVTTNTPSENPYGCSRDTESEISSLQSSLLTLDEELSRRHRRMSTESGKSLPVDLGKNSSLVPADLTHILARHRRSDPSPLFHLKHKSFTMGSKNGSSKLLIVSFEQNATTTRKIFIPGISTPDILVVDPLGERITVASNTGNLVLVCPITPNCMPNIEQIKLEENEKTKGICFLTDRTLLVLVGKQKSNDTVLIPLSGSEKYMIHLTIKELMPIEYISPTFKGSQDVSSVCNVHTLGSKAFYDDHIARKELLMPHNIGIQSPQVKRRLSRLGKSTSPDQSPTSSISDLDDNKTVTDSLVTLENLEGEPTNRRAMNMDQAGLRRKLYQSISQKLCSNNTCESFHLLENNIASFNKEQDVSLTPNLGHYESNLLESHCCLSDVREFSKNSKKMQPYPSLEDPHYVFISCQDPSDDVMTDRKSFLLCNGKLRLQTVQQVFQLTNIELKFGSMWIILTEDEEGFVPITFSVNQEVVIRNVNQKSNCSPTSCIDSISTTEPSSNVPTEDRE